ncbi:MAG: hypothetical protein IPK35_01960 [Saprospiraceae bacterium]|nr:hypothetical protein [Saprospiraceae bacterium]
MDSKLLGSNIAWLSRYELIHKTLELYYKEIKDNAHLEATLKEKLEDALKMQGDKVVYTHTSQEVKSKLKELGTLISKVLEANRRLTNRQLQNITKSIHRTVRDHRR